MNLTSIGQADGVERRWQRNLKQLIQINGGAHGPQRTLRWVGGCGERQETVAEEIAFCPR